MIGVFPHISLDFVCLFCCIRCLGVSVSPIVYFVSLSICHIVLPFDPDASICPVPLSLPPWLSLVFLSSPVLSLPSLSLIPPPFFSSHPSLTLSLSSLFILLTPLFVALLPHLSLVPANTHNASRYEPPSVVVQPKRKMKLSHKH